ncbi:SecDF P1 head subdomain-containing protein [Ferruginibacter albus]|uniref:SecDF P1 head subdomain-containing protein n=1 Tax=Ferruginibacter albus TaxID=2875540 RepID=UPI001CC643EF|nr:hypothetical protein [Ferruginibacter albus]UAY53578.1 hypothetical protein K9M53_07900 [Ferruginibacter albus]
MFRLYGILLLLLVSTSITAQSRSGIYLAKPSLNAGAYHLIYKDTVRYYELSDTPLIAYFYVDTIIKSKDKETGKCKLLIKFSKVGQKMFGDITAGHLQQYLGFVVNNSLLAAPQIVEPILGGTVAVNSDFSEQQVYELLQEIKKLKQ